MRRNTQLTMLAIACWLLLGGIASAQAITGMGDQISHIDLVLDDAHRAWLEARLPPAVRIVDLYARPDIATGKIRVHVTLRNAAEREASAKLEFAVAPAAIAVASAVTRATASAATRAGMSSVMKYMCSMSMTG